MYGLEKALREAVVINEGYGIYQMLHQTDFCYLGRMWLSKDRKTVVKNPHNAMVYGDCVPLRSHDGQMTMGYVVREGDELTFYMRKLLRLLRESLEGDFIF